MRIIDGDEVDLNEKSENTRCIKDQMAMRPEALVSVGKLNIINGLYFQLYDIFWELNRLGNGQVRHSPNWLWTSIQ